MLLQGSHFYRPPSPHKAPWALLITALVLLSSIFELVPTPTAMLAGVVAVVLTGCITMDEAYRAIEWRVVFLIAGMTPVSIALVNTGLAQRIGALFTDSLSPIGPLAIIAGFYLLTVFITQLIGGQVSALIVGPIAITAALQAGVNPAAMAVACAIGCATAFLTPIAHPVNVLMMSPGGYRAADFPRVGIGMTIITFVMLMVGMTLIWGIR
jgi:di/tricarboxylate transporter